MGFLGLEVGEVLQHLAPSGGPHPRDGAAPALLAKLAEWVTKTWWVENIPVLRFHGLGETFTYHGTRCD